ncbi:TRAP transporter substrate-binding protein [Bacillus sp. FJAT-45350]|uniref:TRAP transporter substrate-binding protein n=1 Tax=Bacillus sp. FJAT-45350 TaxID=2011014 RepID=UPI000BB9159F|nr:TRAP transporter substrate-binding protein [Bacillus sp. FJAT-45350]
MSSKKYLVLSLTLSFLLLIVTACGSTETSNDNGSDSNGAGDEGQSHNLMISHFLPANHDIHTGVLVPFAEELSEQTNGRITADIYDNNQLGAPGAHYDMAVTGEADIALSVHAYSAGRFPISTIIDLPFLVQSAEKGGEIFWTLYEEFDVLKEEHGETTPLFLFTAEPAQLLSPNKKIETPEDLRGLRVRTPSPAGAQMLEALGATPVTMPMGEVFEALERGAVDAAMVPSSQLADYSFHEVVKYVTMGNFSATPFFATINTDVYNSLSDSDREILDNLTQLEMSMHAGRVFDGGIEKGYEAGIGSGVEFIELEGEKLAAWEEAFQPIIDGWIADMEAQGVPAQEMYDRALEIKNN